MGFFSDISAEMSGLKPTKKDLRNLGLVFLAAFGTAGLYFLMRGRPAWPYFIGLAILFGAWGLTWPAGLKPIYKFWMGLAAVLGWFVSRLLLSLVFYLVVTPMGLVIRLFGKDLLDKKMDHRSSYWHLRPDEEYDPKRTEKMY